MAAMTKFVESLGKDGGQATDEDVDKADEGEEPETEKEEKEEL